MTVSGRDLDYIQFSSILQDLTFCYLHMTRNDLLILDTIDTAEYMNGELSDDGTRLIDVPKP